MSNAIRTVTIRITPEMYDQLQQAANESSPPNSLSREIIERLLASFDQEKEAEDILVAVKEWREEYEERITALEAKIGGKK